MFATTMKTFTLPAGIKVTIDDTLVSVTGPYHAFLDVKDYVKASGFKWEPEGKVWARHYQRKHDREGFVKKLRDRLTVASIDYIHIPAPPLSYRIGAEDLENLQKILGTEKPQWAKGDRGWNIRVRSNNPSEDLLKMQRWATDLQSKDSLQVGPTAAQSKVLSQISKEVWRSMLRDDPMGRVYEEKPSVPRFESIPRTEINQIIDLYHRHGPTRSKKFLPR